MLVLSRKQKQQIRIGDNVVVTVLQIKGGSVRIGIEAPREIHVMRGELEDFSDSESTPKPQRDILAMTKQPTIHRESAEQANESETASEQADQKVLELRFQGGGTDDAPAPTRLSEIASSIPSLHLPR